MLKQLFKKLFDYEITGEYYDLIVEPDGWTKRIKRYNKRYYLRCYREWKKKRLRKGKK